METQSNLGRSPFQPKPTHQDYGVTHALFEEWRCPRFGTANPSNLTNPFWVWQVKTKIEARWVAREFLSEQKLKDREAEFLSNPTWCIDRHDTTCTHLSDGRLVFIGGWNPDPSWSTFAEYNDVVVIEPSGEVTIYGYPEGCFPRTRNHSATLVEGKIVIIGNLDGSKSRNLKTQFVYQLDVNTLIIERTLTHGAIPPAISDHWAELDPDGKSIQISGWKFDRGYDRSEIANLDDWSLDLLTWQWKRLTHCSWPRWELQRKDGERSHIWKFRDCLDRKKRLDNYLKSDPVWAWKHSLKEKLESSLQEIVDDIGQPFDYDLFDSLYRPSLPHQQRLNYLGEVDPFRIRIDGVEVRFVEIWSEVIQMTVKGELPASTIQTIIEEILAKLKLLENAQWTATPIQNPAASPTPDTW